jgi:ABC-type sugar transport system ATPase subunit
VTARDAILTFDGIAKTYGAADVLRDVTLDVPSGAFTVVYGPPAAGKSVLMRVLMGLEKPDAGRVTLRGADVTAAAAADRNIGYVPQSFALYPHLSVRDNIAYPLTLTRTPPRKAEPIVEHAAAMLKIGDLLAKRPDQLSGGQKQRVAIARGIAKRTELYVLDDPLAGLDFKLREQLVEDLRGLQQETRATFLYTTSDAIEALTLADRLAVLDGGRIVEAGEPERLYREPERVRTMALVGFPPTNFLDGTLELRGDAAWCRTRLFDFPVRLATGAGVGAGTVLVGLRPEDLAIGGATVGHVGNGHAADRRHVDARVLLREDLGGEEIVYLDCDGTPLAGLDRHHDRDHRADLDAPTTVAIRPRDLIVFKPSSGERIGRGADAAATGGPA